MSVLLAAAVFQLASSAPAQILVRGDAATETLAVRQSGAAAHVRADRLAAPLGGTLRLQQARFHLTVGGREFEFVDGVPFARVGDAMHPLADAPIVRDGKAWVPLHFVTEVLQRVSTGMFYDPVYLELRQFTGPQPPPRSRAVVSSRPTAPAPRRGASTPTPARRADVVPTKKKTSQHVIVIDAGHGGPDGGMHGTLPGGGRINEKEITLGVSRRLAEVLRARGYGVVMTRTRDTLIALSDRGRIANEAKGDLFLSIHVNAANPNWKNPTAARGVETYFLSAAKTDDARRVEQMENESVRFETAATTDAGDPLSFVLTDMQQNEHLRESSDVAALVQRQLAAMHPGPSRGVKQAGFRVLVKAYMPAVLIEIGFGTNPREAAFMSDPDDQRRIAEAIARAADAYFDRYEKRVAGGQGGAGGGS